MCDAHLCALQLHNPLMLFPSPGLSPGKIFFFFFLNLAAPGLSCGYRIFNLCCGVQDLLIVTYRI